MRTWIGVLAVVSVVIGTVLLASLIAATIEGTSRTSPGGMVSAAVLFLLMIGGGIYLARRNLRPDPVAVPHNDFEREQCILNLAETSGGRVTIPEVATHCKLSVETSKRVLDRLARDGAAEMLVSQHGVVIYAFGGFVSEQEKASAEGV